MSGTKRISALTELASGSVDEDDILAIVDMSQASVTDKTKHVKVSSLLGAAASDGKPKVSFKTVAAFIADDNSVVGYSGSEAKFKLAEGDIFEAGGHRYSVRATGASDNHVASAGGFKADVLPKAGRYDLAAFGCDPTGATDDTSKIILAIAAAAADGNIVDGTGTFLITSKVVINCGFDGSRMTWNVDGAPAIAVEVSTGSASNPTDIFTLTTELGIVLPSLVNLDKPGTGWASQGIGVRYVNVQNMKITERLVENFAIGVQHTSYDQGCGYCTVIGGYLRNNGVNRQFTTGNSSGFTNRWDFIGGRYFHLSAEGTAVSGVYHIEIDAIASGNILNDFNFFGASLEGSTQEYQVVNGGTHVNFFGCRWETSGGPKIYMKYGGIAGQGSGLNIFAGRGSGETSFVITKDASATATMNIVGSGTAGGLHLCSNPIFTLQNGNSSAEAVLVAYEAAQDAFSAAPNTNYAAFIGAQDVKGKRSGDTYDRIRIELDNGAVYVGNGSVAPTAGIAALGSSGVRPMGNMYFPDTGTSPSALAGYAPIWFDATAGEFKFRRPDGTVRTITSS